MSTIQSLWQNIENQYNSGTFPDDQLEKIDVLVYSDDIEDIRNGLTLMTTLAPEYLCRYLTLNGNSVVLRDVGRFGDPLRVEEVLVETMKDESIWQAVFESGAFDSMKFRSFGDLKIKDLSETEKAFCIQMAKDMVLVPAGEFMMGALEDDSEASDWEKPRHLVTLTRDFWVGRYAVTQVFWESVMGANPSHFNGANRPVEQVSWFDCVLFCNELSKREGLDPAYSINGRDVTWNQNAKGYRLLTEAEWEYSARGGEYHKYSGSNTVGEVAWNCFNSNGETHFVGLKKQNGFGLFDMSGNVWEWCWDLVECEYAVYDDDDDYDDYDDYEDNADFDLSGKSAYSEAQVADPSGATVGSDRIWRGGSWYGVLSCTRASDRNLYKPEHKVNCLGFRICRFSDPEH